MVLPGRIELPTSPLPRECSTTELRQRTMAAGGRTHATGGGLTQPRRLTGGRYARKTPGMAAEKTRSEQRKERLAKALKANIARRKDAARARGAEAPETAEPPPDDKGCPN